MTKEDLKQIKGLLQENNAELRSEMSDLMDTKLEKAFEKNNEELDKKFEKNNEELTGMMSKMMDEKLETAISDIAGIVNTAFTEFEERVGEKFADLKEELSGIKHDVANLKFLHIKELKSVPDSLTVISALADESLN